MQELKLYSVSDKYIEYLRDAVPEVYSNKINERKHTRKYLGVALMINNYCYYIPLSSPKSNDYITVDGEQKIRKSIVPIIRITAVDSDNVLRLKGTLRISNMIPVPESELELYDVDSETDLKYKDLISNEIIFIRKNRERIISNARLIYKQKSLGDETASYLKATLNFKNLEHLCDSFIAQF